mgnify:CR=1 FL=1
MGKKRNIVIILIVMIMLQLAFITYMFAFQKEGFHSDDNWSYGFANADDGGWIDHNDDGETRNFNEWVDGKILWDYVTVQKGKQFDFAAVARNMKDERNPPLHHMILHAVCSFFPDTFSWWYGYSINMISFAGMMIALYFLGKEYLLSTKKALLVCFFYGFSVAALNNMLFLRPYCMLTFFSILLMFFHVKMYRKHFISCRKELTGIFFTMLLGNLTQYTFLMYGMCVMIVFGIYELIKKKWKFAILHGCVMLVSVAGTVLIWPRTLELLAARHEMYSAQMPLAWEIKFSMLLSVGEATGIPFKLPDIVFWTYVKFIFIFLIIITAGVTYICRHESWFQKAVETGKKSGIRMGKWLKKKVFYGEKISVILMLTVFMTLISIAYYCNLFLMSLYADRYFFFLMPFFTITGQICWISRHVFRRQAVKYIITIVMCIGLLLSQHKILVPSWYLFERQCDGAQLEELTKDVDVILITDSYWKLTWYSTKLMEVSKFYAVLATDCMNGKTLSEVDKLQDDSDRPVLLILETDKFRDENWNESKSREKSGIKTNEEILTLSYKKSEVVDRFAKARWADKKKFIQHESGFTGQIEVWQLR